MSTTAISGFASPPPSLQGASAASTDEAASAAEPLPPYLGLSFGQTLSALGLSLPANVDDPSALIAMLALQFDKLFKTSRAFQSGSPVARIEAALTQIRAVTNEIQKLAEEYGAAAEGAEADRAQLAGNASNLDAANRALAAGQSKAAQAQKDLDAATTDEAKAAARASLDDASAGVAQATARISELAQQQEALNASFAQRKKLMAEAAKNIAAKTLESEQIVKPKFDGSPEASRNAAEAKRSDLAVADRLSDIEALKRFIAERNARRETNQRAARDEGTRVLTERRSAEGARPDSSNVDNTIVQTNGLVQTNRDPNLQTPRGFAQLLLRDRLEDFARSDRIPGAVATLLRDFVEAVGALAELLAETSSAEPTQKSPRIQIPG